MRIVPPAKVEAEEASGLARLVLMVLDRIARCGLSREELLRQARLDEAQLRDPDHRIPISAVARLWRAIAAHTTQPTIGLRLGKDVRAREFGLVGYVMVCSKTLGEALTRLDRYDRIVSDALNIELDAAAGATWVRLHVQSPLQALRPAADARVAALVSVCRELVGPLQLLTVRLPYREPPHTAEYDEFFRAPVEFGSLATAFLVSADDLERPVAQCDETLAGYLDHLAQQLLVPADDRPTVRDQIRRRLWADLPDGVPDLTTLARGLGMSSRTLQRRLRDEGTTFHQVLVELRREAAPALLRDGRLAVSEVAFLLGYEDPSSFQRAFRDAFGVSPRVFRRTA
ncbi:MAG TPA: AraC family transcriptional regulator [Methylomirabilota bacterium]